MATERSWFRGKFRLNYIVDIECSHCGASNRVKTDVAKSGGCCDCKLPLNWSIPKGTYLPNYVPRSKRLEYLFLSLVLITLGIYAIVTNELWLPYGSKHYGYLAHFSGLGLLLPVLAMLCGLAVSISVFLDHMDIRQNENSYRRFHDAGLAAGYLLYFAAVFFADKFKHV